MISMCYAQGNKNKVVYVANLYNFENNNMINWCFVRCK
jgi:hypothetical protein